MDVETGNEARRKENSMLKPTFTTEIIEEKPTKSDSGVETGSYYKIALEPLEQGYGNTLGNALRRVLLNSISGTAVTKVKIKGINHQFTTLDGMSEDIVEFILNIKQLRLSMKKEKTTTLKINAKGPGDVKAKDIDTPAGVKIANPNLVLATLANRKTTLEAELEVKSGIGYSQAEADPNAALGEIPVDALYSPITKVSYHVEATRVGRRTDFDKLIMEIYSDGTIEGVEALEKAAKVLVKHFEQVYNPIIIPETEEKKPILDNENLSLTVEELDIPTRIANALRKGGYKTVKDLTQATSGEIAKVKNLGEKSVDTIAQSLKKKEVGFKEKE